MRESVIEYSAYEPYLKKEYKTGVMELWFDYDYSLWGTFFEVESLLNNAEEEFRKVYDMTDSNCMFVYCEPRKVVLAKLANDLDRIHDIYDPMKESADEAWEEYYDNRYRYKFGYSY